MQMAGVCIQLHGLDDIDAEHGRCVHSICKGWSAAVMPMAMFHGTALGAAVMSMTHVCIQLHARPMAAVTMLAAACI